MTTKISAFKSLFFFYFLLFYLYGYSVICSLTVLFATAKNINSHALIRLHAKSGTGRRGQMRTCEKSTLTAYRMSYPQHHQSLTVSGDDVLEEHDSKLNKSFVTQLTVCLYLLIYKTHYIIPLQKPIFCCSLWCLCRKTDMSHNPLTFLWSITPEIIGNVRQHQCITKGDIGSFFIFIIDSTFVLT